MMTPQPVLTAAEMRAADDYTIRTLGIDGFTLMESAGRGTADHIERHLGAFEGQRVNVYCGKGNNGGDGFVIARVAYDRGAIVHVVTMSERGQLAGEAASHFDLLERVRGRDDGNRLTITAYTGTDAIPPARLHIDALLGTGLTSDLREPLLTLVRWLNDQPGGKIAVDISTGLHTDLGRPLGDAFHADLTLTMATPKSGHFLNDGPTLSGTVQVIDIGIPRFLLDEAVHEGKRGCAYRSSDRVVRAWLPVRGPDANKYSVGLALVVAGSPGMTGAPIMAATAAARAGAGYVVCGCDLRIQSILGARMTEVTTVPLSAGDDGLDPEGAMRALDARLQKAAAGLIGCGLGTGPATQEFVRRFLSGADLPLVVDADGLNALAGNTSLIRNHAGGRWILTPHMGEFRRLAGDELDAFDPGDRIAIAQHFARAWNCVLLLKGLPSVVAAPDGSAWIAPSANSALASAGTGDVLAGLCAGFLAQGMRPVEAAVTALHVGGAAVERYTQHRSGRSMQALDLRDLVPVVLKERFET